MGNLHFLLPDSVASVATVDSNAYFEYVPSNNSFIVKSRIDVDRGLNMVQLMILECTRTDGLKLPVKPVCITCCPSEKEF